MRLSELKTGQGGIIVKVLGHGAFRKRIMEMGFVRGKRIEVVLNAPLRDPIKYSILGYEISLRRSEAAMIEVIVEAETEQFAKSRIEKRDDRAGEIERTAHTSGKQINVALVGNPNSGKTSLFNAASGRHEHVGNYSGVTIDAKRGQFRYKDYHFTIYDLPGTYALTAYTPEELYVRHHLEEVMPDVIVNVVAASNLERNLYLTTELIDMDCSMVIALNMYDELEASGATLDYTTLGGMIGIPVVPTNSRQRKGIDELFDTIIRLYEHREKSVRHIHINHGPALEAGIKRLKAPLKADPGVPKQFSPRYLAIKLLEKDKVVETMLNTHPDYPAWSALRDETIMQIEKELGTDIESAITDEKYGFIAGALRETYHAGEKEDTRATQVIDTFVTHKLWGFPIFLLLMFLMFEATFQIGIYPMKWIEAGVAALGGWISGAMADGPLRDLLADGVIGGVGSVIVFLPNILILYLCISFMEESGYMARAAFIMDKIMHRIGLHGKSFIPLIMGFGCNVPAILSARTIESRSSRIITILITPFISCSARLPVYILLAGTFFPKYAGTVIMGLYLLGIVVAVLTAKLLRRFLFRSEEMPFVMELPPYRMPAVRSTLRQMWEKVWHYLRKMGGLILVASLAVWFLSYYPRTDRPETAISEAQIQSTAERQENSYIGRIGNFIEPAVKPLGFNGKISVSLLSGLAAKELIVSTLGVLYAEGDTEETGGLSQKMSAVNPETGTPDFTPLIALSFLVFVLLYFPCIAAMISIRYETGAWKWTLFAVFYNTAVAWIAAFLTFNIGKLFY